VTTTTEKFLTAKELVARWEGAVAENTLNNWRSLGKGPGFIKLGRQVRYPESAVVEYEQTLVKSAA
jgi:hypothetical protein